MTRITASIVSTGEARRLGPCLRSLAAQELDGTLEVIVVDNAGDDDAAVVVARDLLRARVLRNEVRRGFAENHNRAQAEAQGEAVLVLNPDVVLAPGCVAALVDALERHPRAGLVAPLLVYPSGAMQPSARRFPRVWGTLVRRTPLRWLGALRGAGERHLLPAPATDRTVDWALGACLCARGAAWREIGGFDPGFRPLYVEDVDLAWRMWRAGWEVWQTPSARAVHEHQAATDRVFWDRRTLWHMRGIARFVRKHPRILMSPP